MNSPNNRDLEQKLQELERELDRAASKTETNTAVEPEIQPNYPTSNSLNFDGVATTLKNGFNALPPAGKIVVALVASGFALSVVSGVLHLLTSLIVLAIVGTLGYCAYQWFIKD
ncbi:MULTISPECIES: hypothetical protein [Spirulina sp. CCY15215]|uniref:hypothetical protein n=1 Tax=Spirulina sp. CCY15215 TaxID=2767591 RepID=UPI001950568C|nr:hypothetical protein [Spirulina major]